MVGAITSPDVSKVISLMNSLVHKIDSRSDVTLRVILLENGGHGITVRDALRKAVDQTSRQGLDITLKTLEQQAADAVDWELVSNSGQLTGQKSIAMSRTMLQHYLFLEASPRAAAVVWILDDDIVLESMGYGPDGSRWDLRRRLCFWHQAVKKCRHQRGSLPRDGRPSPAGTELHPHPVGRPLPQPVPYHRLTPS